MDLTTPEGVVEYMGQSIGEEDWDQRADAVKKANNGYPSFWWEKVVEAGVHNHVPGMNPGISVSFVDVEGTWSDGGTYNVVTHERIS